MEVDRQVTHHRRTAPDPLARDRLYSDDEIERICFALGLDQSETELAISGYQRVAVAFLFAIETAMRAGEICGLVASDIAGRTAILRQTKNRTKRSVPLSRRAVELLYMLPEVPKGATVWHERQITRRTVPQSEEACHDRRWHLS